MRKTLSPYLQTSSVDGGTTNQSEFMFCIVILMNLRGTREASFYVYTRNDQISRIFFFFPITLDLCQH